MAEKATSSGSILVAHLADLHLRDTQYVTTRRGLDFFEAAKRAVIDAAKAADVLVLVGDIFDRARPSPKVIGQLMQLDQILTEAGKPMLSVTGNHDWCSPTWLSTLFPGREPAVGELAEDAAGIIPIDGASVTFKGFTFAGLHPYSGNAFRQNLAEVTVAARDADVVLYHGLVDGVVDFYAGKNDPLRVDEFPLSKNNKAWLLGDIHVQGFMTRDRPGGGTTLIGYPGPTETCRSSEAGDKAVPLIRVSKEAATVEATIPVTTRPFISTEIHSADDLEALMSDVTAVAKLDPVVVVKFSREFPQTINRLHSTLDAQRAVIRCYPLPNTKPAERREVDTGDGQRGMDHFVTKQFKGRSDLESVALDLLTRGDTDADSIVAEMVDTRVASMGVRDDD